MKKYLLMLLPPMALVSAIYAQTNASGICIQVEAPAGGYAANGRYAWTVGEPVIATFNLQLTQGFHQPEYCTGISVAAPQALNFGEIRVYPNPAQDYLTIEFASAYASPDRVLVATVFDLSGKKALETTIQTASGSATLSCSSLPSGIWFLHLMDTRTKESAVLRFVRLE